MSETPPKSLFNLHRSDGSVERGLTAQEITGRILDGSITEIDFVSASGLGPRPFWQFREFAALSTRVRKTGSPTRLAQPATGSRAPLTAASPTRITPAHGQPSTVTPSHVPVSPTRVTHALEQPSGILPAQQRTGTNPRLTARPPRLFADNLLKLRPEPFRARLLDTSPPDIVGATLDDSAESIAAAVSARIQQIDDHYSPRLFAEEDATALEEAKSLILRTAAAMVLPDRREAIASKAAAIGRLPLLREVEAIIPSSDAAVGVMNRLSPQPQSIVGQEVANPTDSILHALESGTSVQRSLPLPGHGARHGSDANVPAQRTSSAKAQQEPSPWGGGNLDAGARATMGPLVTVWVSAVGTILLSDWGRFEHQLGLLDPMNLIRFLLLVGATLLATRLLRNEPLSALGFSPAAGWNWALPLAGLLSGYLLSELWSFQYDRTAGIGAIILIAALRALAEGLFFEGHVARTLFVASRTPFFGIALAAGGSAAYMASFFDVLRSETPITPLILGFWFLFVGIPAALSMWVSRSVLIPIGLRFCAIVALYLMQSAQVA